MSSNGSKAIDKEARERKRIGEQDKLLLEKARIMLRDDAVPDDADLQDKRVEAIREASYYATIYLKSQAEQAMARIDYRMAKKFDNKQGIEAAEERMRNALRAESEAIPELIRLLPLCPTGLIMAVEEWRNIGLLPIRFREIISRDIARDDKEVVDDVVGRLAEVT